MNPFYRRPSYMALDDLPWETRLERLKDPETKAAILSEDNINPHIFVRIFSDRFDKMYPMEDPIEYLPDADQSVAARAEAAGEQPASWLYDFFLENDGKNLIYIPAANYNADIPRLLQHPFTVSALGDGGAHVGSICDTSANIYVLTKWVKKESKVELAKAIHLLTQQPASLYSLTDRGMLGVGKKADVNVIDIDRLQLKTPHIVHDLPAGGKRFLQNAEGLEATIVAGEITFLQGQPTGALPGKLVRSGQITA
jgi:N-acyl-D-amino-acid deacylase